MLGSDSEEENFGEDGASAAAWKLWQSKERPVPKMDEGMGPWESVVDAAVVVEEGSDDEVSDSEKPRDEGATAVEDVNLEADGDEAPDPAIVKRDLARKASNLTRTRTERRLPTAAALASVSEATAGTAVAADAGTGAAGTGADEGSELDRPLLGGSGAVGHREATAVLNLRRRRHQSKDSGVIRPGSEKVDRDSSCCFH